MIDEFKNPVKYALSMLAIVIICFILGIALMLVLDYYHVTITPAPDVSGNF